MKKLVKFENFKEEEQYFIVGYGLGGGFGGIQNYEVVKMNSEEEASNYAWEKACEEYEGYAGMHGLRTIEDIMDEDEVEEDEAEEIYNEERESWLDYVVLPFTKKNLKKVSGYHFNNPYEEETSKLNLD